MDKCYITDELVEFLNLKPNTLYKESTILQSFKNTKLNTKEILVKFPGYKMCDCGSCTINKKQFYKYIKSNFLIKDLKPDNFCYEYNEQPVMLSSINFDI